MDLYRNSDPDQADMTLKLDSGQTIDGIHVTHDGRSDAKQFTLPEGASGGAELLMSCDGWQTQSVRGILKYVDGGVIMDVDDFHLLKNPEAPKPPEPPQPSDSEDQLTRIQQIYATSRYNLSPRDG